MKILQKLGQHSVLRCSTWTLAEDLAGVGAWAWVAPELNLGKVVITNQTKSLEVLDYELINERHLGTLKKSSSIHICIENIAARK